MPFDRKSRALTHSRSRRFAALALSAPLLAGLTMSWGSASAQGEVRIATLSLLGDKLSAVTQQSRTGTRISQNVVDDLQLPAGVLDGTAVSALTDAVLKADATAKVAPLKLASSQALGDPDRLFSGAKFQVPAQLDPILKQLSATHLLVLTAYRAPAKVQGWRDGIGSGSLEGMGFYLDRELRMKNTDTGQQQVGYIAPFTYYKVWLVGLSDGAILGSAPVAHAEILSSADLSGAGDPWDTFSTKQKMELLDQMLKKDLESVVPGLLKKK